MVASRRFGVLSTHSVNSPGFPFGSLVGFAPEADGNVLLFVSALAMHTRNILADARASLHLSSGEPEVLASPRVTILGSVGPLQPPIEPARGLYIDHHPEARRWLDFGDFRLLRLRVERAYYVAGFGSMGWIDGSAYAAAEVDPLIEHADGIIEHMNSDHADAVLLYARVFGGVDAHRATLVSVDRLGMRIVAQAIDSDETETLRVAFPAECRTTDAVRKATIELLREARTQAASAAS